MAGISSIKLGYPRDYKFGVIILVTLQFMVIITSATVLLRKGDPKLSEMGRNDTYTSNREERLAPEPSLSAYWNDIKEKSFGKETQLIATSLGSFFKKFVDTELAGKRISEYYSSLQFEAKRSKSLEEQAMILSDQLTLQLREYKQALDGMASALLLSATNSKDSATKQDILSCCELQPDLLKYDVHFQTKVSKVEACKTVPTRKKPTLFVPNRTFNKVFVENSMKLQHVKWQYFISPEGVYVEYPGNALNCDRGFKNNRISANSKTPNAKKPWLIQNKDDKRNHRVVFLLQLGPDTTTTMIKSVRSTVLLLLKFLDEFDEIGIVNSFSDYQGSEFLCDQMVPATSWTRYKIMDYLSFIEKNYVSGKVSGSPAFESASSTDGIQKAISMACTNYSSYTTSFQPVASTIIHLRSDGNLDGFELKSVQVDCPVYIDTLILAAVSPEEEEAYRKHMQGFASRNIWRVQVWSTARVEPDSFALKVAAKLNSKKDWWSLSDILSQFFPKEKYPRGIEFSFPHWNPITKEAVVVAKKYVFRSESPLGLVAMEVPLVYFTQRVTYYVDENSYNGNNYAFMIDKQGRVLAHPALGRPDISQEALSSVHIDQIDIHFPMLRRKILEHDRGCISLMLGTIERPVTYAWASVSEFDYVVVLVFQGVDAGCATFKQDYILKKGVLNPAVEVQHNLLLKDSQYCYKQPMSLLKASLYLAPNAFYRPADVLNPQLTADNQSKLPASVMSFLTDVNGNRENQNRGVKSAVRDHIAALSSIVAPWKFQYFTSDWSKYVLRRFGSGGGGTFLMVFPGSTITNGYVPTSARWFKLACQDSWRKKLDNDIRKRVYFTPPIIDYNTGVPFVTVSHVVQANVNTSHAPSLEKHPVAVIGADVNLDFFKRLLEEIMPDCVHAVSSGNSSVVKCLLIDESGYIIYHPQLLHSLKTLRDIHVTQLEPLFVIDVLQYSQSNNFSPMEKKICHKLSEASSTQGSMQRYYQLSPLRGGSITSKHGEHINRYKILRINGTNLFLVTIHDSKRGGNAFCPCSTVDNLCLNCVRMEPSDCECPCECPREPSFCSSDDFPQLPENIQPCDFMTEELPMIQDETFDCSDSSVHSAEYSKRCQSDCALRRNSCSQNVKPEDCLGLFDCTWCDENSTNSNSNKCTTYKHCYGYSGQRYSKKALDPFEITDDSSLAYGPEEVPGNADDDSGTAVIPALAVLTVFIIFLVLVFYCYRHRALNATNSQPDLHLLPLQDSPRCSIVPQAGSSRSDSDGEPFQPVPVPLVPGGRSGRRRHQRFFAAQRSPIGSLVATDSDHGYSTMTPHEESECGATLPFVLIEPPSRVPLSPFDGNDNHGSDAVEGGPHSSTVYDYGKTTANIAAASSKCDPLTEVHPIVVPVTVHEVDSRLD